MHGGGGWRDGEREEKRVCDENLIRTGDKRGEGI